MVTVGDGDVDLVEMRVFHTSASFSLQRNQIKTCVLLSFQMNQTKTSASFSLQNQKNLKKIDFFGTFGEKPKKRRENPKKKQKNKTTRPKGYIGLNFLVSLFFWFSRSFFGFLVKVAK